MEEYPVAIQWFETVIDSPPSGQDSLYAVIDAGYTYLLMEENGGDRAGYIGRMPQLKPVSYENFVQTRSELLGRYSGSHKDGKIEVSIPTRHMLEQNYPNPFNPITTIKYQLAEAGNISLNIYDTMGRLIKTLVNEKKEVGYHSVVWDGKDENGAAVSSGIYLYRIQTGDYTETKQCIMLK